MKSIYLDYASITPIDQLVRKEMDKWSHEPLNPSSIHSLGVKAKKALDASRKGVAEFLNAHSDEIVFTSGGTEANSLALQGAARAAYQAFQNAGKTSARPHLIISAIEHSSIIETANMLEKRGVEVTRLIVDKNGLVSLEQLKKSIKLETFMVSIMTANNEIGTIEPIREIAKIVRDARKKKAELENKSMEAGTSSEGAPQSLARGWSGFSVENTRTPRKIVPAGMRSYQETFYPLFHTDACQSVLYQDLNVEKLGVDLLTLDASKAYGPRGIGALFVKRGTPIEPLIYGGRQENGLRSGTENIPGIVGFAKTLEIAKKKMVKETQRVSELRDYFEREVKKIRPDAIMNGALTNQARPSSSRVPHISNVTFPGVDAEMLVLRLDANGIAVSTKSACLKDEDESYVLRAIGADSKSSIRFSFGRWTKKGDINKALKLLICACGSFPPFDPQQESYGDPISV
jgi:cysteine desulfurase